jgi:hypothetical protein
LEFTLTERSDHRRVMYLNELSAGLIVLTNKWFEAFICCGPCHSVMPIWPNHNYVSWMLLISDSMPRLFELCNFEWILGKFGKYRERVIRKSEGLRKRFTKSSFLQLTSEYVWRGAHMDDLWFTLIQFPGHLNYLNLNRFIVSQINVADWLSEVLTGQGVSSLGRARFINFWVFLLKWQVNNLIFGWITWHCRLNRLELNKPCITLIWIVA